MEPIPETVALLEEFGEFYDADLLGDLRRKAEAVEELVPELVGLSLAALEDGIAFTLVATDSVVAVLDAVQYLMGGPCVDALPAERVVQYDSDLPDDEGQWQTFAQMTAAKAVATTLTLPILDADKVVVGTINLYAGASGAFRGQHREIAEIFDAWAPGAVTNADLAFETRRTAEHAPQRMRALMRIEAAVGLLMSSRALDATAARELLVQAALRAGVTTERLAQTMVTAFETPESGD